MVGRIDGLHVVQHVDGFVVDVVGGAAVDFAPIGDIGVGRGIEVVGSSRPVCFGWEHRDGVVCEIIVWFCLRAVAKAKEGKPKRKI